MTEFVTEWWWALADAGRAVVPAFAVAAAVGAVGALVLIWFCEDVARTVRAARGAAALRLNPPPGSLVRLRGRPDLHHVVRSGDGWAEVRPAAGRNRRPMLVATTSIAEVVVVGGGPAEAASAAGQHAEGWEDGFPSS